MRGLRHTRWLDIDKCRDVGWEDIFPTASPATLSFALSLQMRKTCMPDALAGIRGRLRNFTYVFSISFDLIKFRSAK